MRKECCQNGNVALFWDAVCEYSKLLTSLQPHLDVHRTHQYIRVQYDIKCSVDVKCCALKNRVV